MQKPNPNNPQMWKQRQPRKIVGINSQAYNPELTSINSQAPSGSYRMQGPPPAVNVHRHMMPPRPPYNMPPPMAQRMRYPPVNMNQGFAYGMPNFVPHVMHGPNMYQYVVPGGYPSMHPMHGYQPPTNHTPPRSNVSTETDNTSASASPEQASNNVSISYNSSSSTNSMKTAVTHSKESKKSVNVEVEVESHQVTSTTIEKVEDRSVTQLNVSILSKVHEQKNETIHQSRYSARGGKKEVFWCPPQSKCNDLIRLALHGGDIAEKLAQTHRSRPCFKKIDSLCARMKQDLVRTDSVLPNINSQGIAWAVKDFIFVFTRVVNAWIIMKGYMYNPAVGLNNIKDVLSPDFPASFAAWQDATIMFLESLVKSFVNLDNLAVQQKGTRKPEIASTNHAMPSTPPMHGQPNESLTDLFDVFDFPNENGEPVTDKYTYTMVEDSEKTQRQATVNGTYLTTGTYKPIKKNSPTSSEDSDSDTTLPESVEDLPNANVSVQEKKEEVPVVPEYVTIYPPYWCGHNLTELEHSLREFAFNSKPTMPENEKDDELESKLDLLVDRLLQMEKSDFFFKVQFTKNYFPDYVAKCQLDFMDLRSIILKCQVGGYSHIFEVVHDVKRIVYITKKYLKSHKNPKLELLINEFNQEFDALIELPPFDQYNVEHIVGAPSEKCFPNAAGSNTKMGW